ncbi:hypothetical protein SBI_00165 [Streptomyces bingchenggensis BCW-1]|uniref:Uncharacterized protein n=1 Tax=Streptomyces bingchenggensis (strain BCW-1) TaxID=749414 RepID=D7BUU5_STRBB|nr:hypothetical protein SBI_00165 [Streptomyces bingchenggensis BCW-1]
MSRCLRARAEREGAELPYPWSAERGGRRLAPQPDSEAY